MAKLTELGVDRIVPVAAERSVVRWDAGRGPPVTWSGCGGVAREAAMQIAAGLAAGGRWPWPRVAALARPTRAGGAGPGRSGR